METQTTASFEIQKKLERVRVLFESLGQDYLRLKVLSDFKKREVERSVNSAGIESIIAKHWKKIREKKPSKIELGTDGTIRFTDGNLIYHLTSGALQSRELAIYAIEKNNLSREKEVP